MWAGFHTGMVKAVKSKVTAIDGKVTEYKAAQAALLAPAAAFIFSPAAPVTGQTVSFTDTSAGTPTAWAWTFGDGAVTSARNPTHAYSAAGSYTVTLTVSGTAGSNSASRTVTVTAAVVAPSPAFSFLPSSPSSGQTVAFTDATAHTPTS